MFETNFIGSSDVTPPLPNAMGSIFAASINQTSLAMTNDYGMKKQSLPDADNTKIISAIEDLGFKNINRDMTYFLPDALPPSYVQALRDSKSEHDAKIIEAYDAGALPPFFTYKNGFDGRVMTVLLKPAIDAGEKLYGINGNFLKLEVAHELTHKIIYDSIWRPGQTYEQRMAAVSAGELIADYAAMKLAGAEALFIHNLGGATGNYHHSQNIAQRAFIKVLENIDERLARRIQNTPNLNPLMMAVQAVDQALRKGEPVVLKNEINAALSRFYDENIAPLSKLSDDMIYPRSYAEFQRRIFNTFEGDMTQKAKELSAIYAVK